MSEINKRNMDNKHRIILEAAVRVFCEYGYDGSSMEKIAKAAAVSKITVYNHFHSKENLFLAVSKEYINDKGDYENVEFTLSRSLEEQLMDFAEREIYRVSDPLKRGMAKVLTSVFLVNPHLVEKLLADGECYTNLVAWLGEGKEAGKLDFDSPQIAAKIFLGMLEGCITWKALFTDGESLSYSKQMIDEIISVFLCRYAVRK